MFKLSPPLSVRSGQRIALVASIPGNSDAVGQFRASRAEVYASGHGYGTDDNATWIALDGDFDFKLLVKP